MGESTNACATLRFDRRVRLEFHGATITSDAGLLACRELDDALGLTETASECLQESRGGRNVQHRLVGLLRQSVYSRLAGYEDTNDAECQGRSENVPVWRSKSVPLNLHLVSETMVGSSLELVPLNGDRTTGPGCCLSQGWRETRPVCSL